MDDIINARGTKRNKAITVNYDVLDAPDQEQCLVCLTTAQVDVLIGLCAYLGWKTRWYSPTGATIDQDTIDQFQAELVQTLMDNQCDIGTSIENILTQITEINTNIVEINTNVTNVNNTVVQLKTVLEVTNNYNYQTNIQIVLPNGTFTSDTKDETTNDQYARYLAFCNAIWNWVLNEGFLVLQDIDANSAYVTNIRAYIVGLGLAVLTGNYWQGGIVNTESEIYTAFTTAADTDVFICFLFTYLRDLAPTYANFAAAVNAFPAANANQTIIAYVISAALQYYDAFAVFGSVYQQAFAKAQAAAPTSWDTCLACTLIPQSQVWDYRLGQKSQTLFFVGKDILGTTYDMEAGLKGVKVLNTFTGQYTDRFSIQIDLDAPTAIQDYSYEVYFGPAYAGGGGSATVEFQKLVGAVYTTYETHTLTTAAGLQTGTALAMGDQVSVCVRILLHEQQFFGLPDMRFPIYFHIFGFTIP